MNTKRGLASIRLGMVAGLMAFLLAGSMPNVWAQRDRGVNQPGAAGNRGVGGSARQTRVVGDPGLNQPGRAGNR